MSFFEFPHTRTYDGDLGFLISRYLQLSGDYQNIVSLVDGLETRVQEMVSLYVTIPEQIKTQVDAQTAPLIAEIDKLRANVESLIAELNKSIDQQFELIEAISNNVVAISKRVETILEDANAYTDYRLQAVAEEIYKYIDELSKSFPPVIDPSDGKTEDLQTTLNHMWQSLLPGLTAGEFNALRITRRVFDNAYITRRQFDNNPRYYLVHNPNDYMWSPFTFKVDLVKNVVEQLAYLHTKGITRAEFDGHESTREAFDDEHITVYDWLWNNPWRAGA